MRAQPNIPAEVAALIQRHGPRLVASLSKSIRDIELAQDCVQDAAIQALSSWVDGGLPDKPLAWLHTVARRRALDRLRQQRRATQAAASLAAEPEASSEEDDRLGLLFACCHPAIEPRNQVALALRALLGLSPAEIGRLFLDTPQAISKRLSRTSAKIRDNAIAFAVPSPRERPARLVSVMSAIYLLFTEGYSPSSEGVAVRPAVCGQAIALGHQVLVLLPDEPELLGLLALMTLHHARRDGRLDAQGRLVTLTEQNRAVWRSDEIDSGLALLDRAMLRLSPGAYQIQAAIAALHAQAASAEETDWGQITALYGSLLHFQPSPVVELNAAVALAMSHGPQQALEWVQRLRARGVLRDFHLIDAVSGDLLERLGRHSDAAAAFTRAAAGTTNPEERRYLVSRAQTLGVRRRRRRVPNQPHRTALTDREWERVRTLFPTVKRRRGRPAKPARDMVDAVLWVLSTGQPWRHLPKEHGAWQTAYHRFRVWESRGILASLLRRIGAHPGLRAWTAMPELSR